MLYYVILCHITLHYIISYNNISYYIISYYILLYYNLVYYNVIVYYIMLGHLADRAGRGRAIRASLWLSEGGMIRLETLIELFSVRAFRASSPPVEIRQ